jgi:histone H3/H4
MGESYLTSHSDDTQTLRDLGLGRAALSRGRDSDIRPLALTEEGTDNNFLFTIPPRDASEDLTNNLSPMNYTSPLRRTDLNTGAKDSIGIQRTEESGSDGEDEEAMEGFNQSAAILADDFTQASDIEMAAQEATSEVVGVAKLGTSKGMKKKKAKVSVHGIQYPSLPAGVVKKLATTFARTSGNNKIKINNETVDAIIQASDWFFEQVSDDLGAYAQHAGRKTIDESDVVTLMARCAFLPIKLVFTKLIFGRQRQTNPSTTPFSLAQRYLPRELLQEMRMVPAPAIKGNKQRNSDEA